MKERLLEAGLPIDYIESSFTEMYGEEKYEKIKSQLANIETRNRIYVGGDIAIDALCFLYKAFLETSGVSLESVFFGSAQDLAKAYFDNTLGSVSNYFVYSMFVEGMESPLTTKERYVVENKLREAFRRKGSIVCLQAENPLTVLVDENGEEVIEHKGVSLWWSPSFVHSCAVKASTIRVR